MEKEILVVQDISKSFDGLTVLKYVSFSVKEGSIFFVLGPSGCGKTTLLRIICGFCVPDRGRVMLAGRDITRLPAQERSTGLVFQNYALWPHLTVRENVAYGLLVRKLPAKIIQERVAAILETAQLGPLKDKFPGQLSGGEQQRVALARTLVTNPKILLLDEPLSNLDARLREHLREEIRKVHAKTGITMVYVTHDQREAFSLADKIAVLHQGEILQIGSPRDLYSAPQSKFVAGFLGATNFLKGRVTGEAGNFWQVETTEGIFLTPRKAGLEKTGKVEIGFRPEAGVLARKDGNVLEGQLTATEFSEGIIRLRIQTRQRNFFVLLLAADQCEDLKTGDTVTFAVPPERIMVFPEAGETETTSL